METDRIVEELAAPFAAESIQKRQGAGGKWLDYLATHTVIRRLNAATGGVWDFVIINIEWRGDLAIALGTLTIPGLGTRTAIGVQRVSERGGEDLIKGVGSDCLKKCATLFGVGLELYGEDTEADAPAQQPARMEPEERERVDAQHQRNTQPQPSNLPTTRQQPQPDGRERARAVIVEKCAAKGIPVLDGDDNGTIAESINMALSRAGSGVEVHRNPDGSATAGAILNALLALPAPAAAQR